MGIPIFQPAPLSEAQQKQIADRQLATQKLQEIDDDIRDAESQLNQLYNLWVSFSNFPAQSPLDPNNSARQTIASQYYAELTYKNQLINWRGAVLGWKRNAGQPNHPAEMPTFEQGKGI